MLAYPIPEAEALLEQKLDAAKQSLRNCEDDLDFLREQITVSLPAIERKPRHVVLTMGCRPWKWQQQESTIGMSAREGKRRAATANSVSPSRQASNIWPYVTSQRM